MRRKGLLLCSLLVGTSALSAPALAADSQELKALKSQIEMLMKRIDQLENEQTQQAKKMESTAQKQEAMMRQEIAEISTREIRPVIGDKRVVTEGPVKGSIMFPGTDTAFKIGGYVKADMIYDTKGGVQSALGEDFSAFARTPLEGTADEEDRNFRAHARQSRVNLSTFTPTEYGMLKTVVEGDFFGTGGNEILTNSTSFRLRHAYGELGGFKVGQAWSNFMDLKSYPQIIDFGGPAGRQFIRQGLIQYTHDVSDNTKFSVALENQLTNSTNSLDNAGTSEALGDLPDLTAQWVHTFDEGHVSLRGVGRQLSVRDTGTNNEDEEFGYGIGLSGRYNITDSDQLTLNTFYGDGIGRYIFDIGLSAQDAAIEDQGRIEAIEAWGGYASWGHKWSEDWKSNLHFGYVEMDNEIRLTNPDLENKKIMTFHGNVLWDVAPKVRTGLEYIYGKREVEDGREGELSRIQAGIWYFF